ncbi:MAG: hypothetical protein COU11_02575 [Candidatus Harrisonbacteria bacterium CG10_big_fil_rev_8_21_14_0_10_49_15]|uniref:SD-repeat containing protein B domain-containing protein n=1 Tax=Candidatus Harrisonbacteria bacterium CG10_big_fil_rev_8_21_14_0_10_49_15 TaxID=1974587 RepID=A0A2H0UL18_9BACT|nr:MAG: hypothetical protein COU11_02575 [Candidatus Harrisonbacteria bacterium CG10_big_fil_rev_8_21_14_0_10_49_15]
MNTQSQKGAISTVALIILALFIGGGAYYIAQEKTATPVAETGYLTKSECESATDQTCVVWQCDLVPEDKTYEEVCPYGSIFWQPEGWEPSKPPVENSNGEITRQIETGIGELTLRYEPETNQFGTLTLTGTLARGTPCVDWQVAGMATMDYPTSNINVEIKNANPDAICIQVVGEPQEIHFSASNIAHSANISITFAGKAVFSGQINSGKNIQYGELSGTVSIGPICPVESDPPQQNCKPTPELFAQVKITAKSIDGKITKTITPNLGGTYFAELPAGNYIVSVDSPLGIGGTHQTHPVTIPAYRQAGAGNGITELNISIDTGIR